MVSDIRIKEYVFPKRVVNGSVLTAVFSSGLINGEILSFTIQGAQTPGSIWFAESGNNIEIWRNNALASGTASTNAYPHVFTAGPTNVTGSPYIYESPLVVSSIYWAASGLTSGTGNTLGPITVRYR